jgi:hypothetical protein
MVATGSEHEARGKGCEGLVDALLPSACRQGQGHAACCCSCTQGGVMVIQLPACRFTSCIMQLPACLPACRFTSWLGWWPPCSPGGLQQAAGRAGLHVPPAWPGCPALGVHHASPAAPTAVQRMEGSVANCCVPAGACLAPCCALPQASRARGRTRSWRRCTRWWTTAAGCAAGGQPCWRTLRSCCPRGPAPAATSAPAARCGSALHGLWLCCLW